MPATSIPFLQTTIFRSISTSANTHLEASTTPIFHSTTSSLRTTTISNHPPATVSFASLFTTLYNTFPTSVTTNYPSSTIQILQSIPSSPPTANQIPTHPPVATIFPTTIPAFSTSHPNPEITDLLQNTSAASTAGTTSAKVLTLNPTPSPTETMTKLVTRLKYNPEKKIQPQIKKKVVPSKESGKRELSQRNATKKYIPQRNILQEKIIVNTRNKTPQNTVKKATHTNTTPKDTFPSTPTAKKTTPQNRSPKKTIPPKTKVKKINSLSTSPKKTIISNPTMKKNTQKNSNSKKSFPLNPIVNATPQNNTSKKSIPLKTNVKMSNQPNTNPKKNIPANPTAKKKPANTMSKKNIPSNPTAKRTTINNTPKKIFQSNSTMKKSTPTNTMPKMTIPKTNVKKANPHSPKNASTSNITPKKTTKVVNFSKRKIPSTASKKTAPLTNIPGRKNKPLSKKNVSLKTNTKKNNEPKKFVTKQPQTKANFKKALTQASNGEKSKVNVKLNQVKEIKSNPKQTIYYITSSPTSHQVFCSTVPSSSTVQDALLSLRSSESKVSSSCTSGDAEATHRTPVIHYGSTDKEATVPRHFDNFITPSDINTMTATQTISYSEVTVKSRSEATGSNSTFPSGDDNKESYSSSAVVTDTVVLEDSLSMVIPTIKGEDTAELASPPWLDMSYYIPVGAPFHTTTSDLPATLVPTAVPHTKKEQATTVQTVTPEIISTLKTQQNAAENNENNSIDLFENRVVGADSDISQNNLIPKHLRERTRNKRIQELLEEKRNFLLRMKRGNTQ